jgi:hypothetical protein
MASCSVLISSGTAKLRKTANLTAIYAGSINHFIIDNIKINGSGYGTDGIYVYNSSYNSTFNNIDIYRNNI